MPARKLFSKKKLIKYQKKRSKLSRVPGRVYAFKRNIDPIYISNVADATKINGSDLGAVFNFTATTPDYMPGTVEVGMTPSFSLSDAINSVEFTNLYDQYQIAGIKMTITNLRNVSTDANPYIPELVVSRDLDDTSVPISDVNDILQRQDVKVYRLTRPVSLFCTPSVLVGQAGTGASLVPFGQTRKDMFIDCNNPGIVHPSWKMYLRNAYLGPAGSEVVGNVALRVDAKLYLKFKNVR